MRIALSAHQLVGQGMGLGQVRATIAAGFGSIGVPGTPTALPELSRA